MTLPDCSMAPQIHLWIFNLRKRIFNLTTENWGPLTKPELSGYLSRSGHHCPCWKTGRLPWWLSGKELAFQCKEHWFDPWFKKIPHAVKHLRLWATTTEPVPDSPRCATREATAMRNPRTETSEEPLQRWRPAQPTVKHKYIFKN